MQKISFFYNVISKNSSICFWGVFFQVDQMGLKMPVFYQVDQMGLKTPVLLIDKNNNQDTYFLQKVFLNHKIMK